MSIKDGGPAFPRQHICEGMTLRDYFAAKAMQGILHLPARNESNSIAFSRWAYEMADAMLAERSKGEGK